MANNAPYTPTLRLPDNGDVGSREDGVIVWDEDSVFTWDYADPDYGDFQSRADFRYKIYGTGSWTTVTNADTNTYSYTLPASTWAVSTDYEYQVSVFDASGLQSPWTASRVIYTIDTPTAATITTPADASAQTSTPVSVGWSLPTDFAQDAYRVIRANTSAGSDVVYYDSGVIETFRKGGTTSGHAMPAVPLDVAAARTDYVILTYRIYGFWSAPAVVSIVVTILAPKVPLFTAVQVPGRPEVVISIAKTDGFIGYAATMFNDIFRDGVRIATLVPDGGYFTDLLPGAGPVEYTIHGVAASGAKTISY